MPGTVDFGAIAAALATEFGAVSAPGSLPGIASSTAELPENIATTPCVLVFPFEETDWQYEPSQREGLFTWPVRFIYDMAKDLPRRTADLYDWLGVLYAVYPVNTNITLGLPGYVRDTTVRSAGIIRLQYPAGSDTVWPCIEVRVDTLLGEPITSLEESVMAEKEATEIKAAAHAPRLRRGRPRGPPLRDPAARGRRPSRRRGEGAHRAGTGHHQEA